jgi:hypothetical protein
MRLEYTNEEGREVRLDVHIEKNDLRITRTPMGVRVELGIKATLPRERFSPSTPSGLNEYPNSSH